MANGRENAGFARRAVTLAIFAYCAESALQTRAAPLVMKTQAMKYLAQYGYMPPIDPKSREMTVMDADTMSSAVSKFQNFMRMDLTGKLDANTSHMMTVPRCGEPDMGELKMDGGLKRQYFQDSKWNVMDLTYKIGNHPKNLSTASVDGEIAKAFALWSEHTNLTFSRTTGKADIDIGFYSEDHGDEEKFDGPGNTVAHCFHLRYESRVHFDDDEDWIINGSYGYSLLDVAAHEFGHALGLHHSSEKSDIMYPLFDRSNHKKKLHKNDIFAVQALYRPKVNEVPKICEDPKIDAMFTYADRHTYAFKGNYYWKLTTNETAAEHPKLISTKWNGLPGEINAAFTYEDYTYFFKGSKYWRYYGDRMSDGFPREISQGFRGIPDNVDAATVWTGDGKIYFFKGTEFWKFDSNQRAHPGSISEWEGLPGNLDAAVVYKGKTFFFKGGSYYRFNDRKFSVDHGIPAFPRPNGEWFDCQKLGSKN